MFNKNIQETKFENNLYQKELIEEIENKDGDNRYHEINIIITPTCNYFEAIPYDENNTKDKIFPNIEEARIYLQSLVKNDK